MQTPIERWRAVPAETKIACLQGAHGMVAELEQALATMRDPAQAAAVAQAFGGSANDAAVVAAAMALQIEAWRAAIGLLATVGG